MRFVKLPLLLAAFLTLGLAGCGSDADCPPCGSFAVCSAGACVPDAALDVGPFGSDFQSASLTRGYWFTAPVAFTVTGLRVPIDVGTEVQNIEIVRLTAVPPNYATVTNAFTSLGRFVNVAGTSFVPVNIPVAAGDIIGILGARGTTTMHNSYGTTNTYATTIKGSAVTLQRLGMQFNLNTTPAKDLWTEAAGVLSQVEMSYR